MKQEEAQKVLYCAMSVGERLLTCGAEVGRVEDTIRRICMAYGAVRVDVFSITSSIVTTMFLENHEVVTQTRRVSGSKNDLHRLDRLNQLSRRICARELDFDAIQSEIAHIDDDPGYSFAMQMLIYATVSGAFTIFFGGNWKDMIAAAIIGILLKLVEPWIMQLSANRLFSTLLCSIAGGFMANTAVSCGLGTHTDLICIGNIMLFIPGVAFTNSLRDMFSGDTITGLIRFCESILLAIIIAAGFTVANFFF